MAKLLPSVTASGAVKVAVGATRATDTDAEYSVKPPSLSMTRPRTVRTPPSAIEHSARSELVAGSYVPEPQSKAYVKPAAASALDASDGFVNDSSMVLPSVAE